MLEVKRRMQYYKLNVVVAAFAICALSFAGCEQDSAQTWRDETDQSSDEAKAIRLVQDARIVDVWPEQWNQRLDQLRPGYRLADSTVQSEIARQMKQVDGHFEVGGWRAKKINETTFMVVFFYERNMATKGWAFEAIPSLGIVRDIESDPELKKYYEDSVLPSEDFD